MEDCYMLVLTGRMFYLSIVMVSFSGGYPTILPIFRL